MDADLDTLATALYVFTDDVLRDHPEQLPPRPRGGITPKLSDAELLTVAVLQALLGFTSEHRWIRYAHAHLRPMFPHCLSSPATTSVSAGWLRRWPGWSVGSVRPPRSLMTRSGWSIRLRWSVAGLRRPRSARTWPAGPATATAPPIPVSSGVCGCIWSAPCTGCRSAGH